MISKPYLFLYIMKKLLDKGIPENELAFIHDANTEIRKKELFAKVRLGKVRVLFGSTAKLGAGTNVQDRLIKLHDLDCPWRPRDLEQRAGRIVRQGNNNKEVFINRYATEGTFDAYLYQTIENKQKFISQIMSSKSPVRACDDVDETALSYAEIKALCAGNPLIKEKMDLDIEVARLKLLKGDHQSQHYRLEDNLLKFFPESIESTKVHIAGFKSDIAKLAAETHKKEEGISPMVVHGVSFDDRGKAGAALLEACKKITSTEQTKIGTYRGFNMLLSFDTFNRTYQMTLKGAMSHSTTLGGDAFGNITRINNALEEMPTRLKSSQAQLENLNQQVENAKEELQKPFPMEHELSQKSERLAILDAELNMDSSKDSEQEQETSAAKGERVSAKQKPSILEKLKQTSNYPRNQSEQKEKSDSICL